MQRFSVSARGMTSPASPVPQRRSVKVLLALAAGLVLLLGTVGGSVWLAARNGEALAAVKRRQQAMATASSLEIALQNAEGGQRGFLLTGREAYLDRYEAAVLRLPSLFAELDSALPEARARPFAAQLRAAADGKLAELRRTIELARAGDRDGALAVVLTDEGEALMDEIRRLTAAFAADRNAELDRLFGDIERRGAALIVLNGVGAALVVVLGALLAIGSRRSIRASRAAGLALAAANTRLEQSNASLGTRVARRTADLTEANEEMQRFAYIVSHDLRAPLVNIMGFTGELEQAAGVLRRHVEAGNAAVPDEVALAANDDIPEALRFIKASTAKMDRLIGAILTLSREGRRSFSPEPLAMRALLGTVADNLAHQTQSAGAAVELGEVPDLVADKLAVEQVFANLIENALKYGQPSRPVRIQVSGRLSGGMAHYSVSDNGRGIAERDRERVFELFRRAGDQTVPGEGIGLAHVRALVRRLGGSISFESVLNAGTTFHVRLPPLPPQPADEAA